MELKPCPFCGGRAKLYERKDERPSERWYVECTGFEKCDVLPHTYSATKLEAIEAWNTRADFEFGAVAMTEENMAAHGWVRERTCHNTEQGCKELRTGLPVFFCSECGEMYLIDSRAYFCPNCGARVVEEVDRRG